MAKDNVAEDLRAELKTLADTLEEVLNPPRISRKKRLVNCAVKPKAR